MNRCKRIGAGLLLMSVLSAASVSLTAGADVKASVSSATTTKSQTTPRLASLACNYLLSMKKPLFITTSSFIKGVTRDAKLKSNMTDVALSYSLNYAGLNLLESVNCTQLSQLLESPSSANLKAGTTASSDVENLYGVLEDCAAVQTALSAGTRAQNFFPGESTVQSAIRKKWPHLRLILAAKNVSDF